MKVDYQVNRDDYAAFFRYTLLHTEHGRQLRLKNYASLAKWTAPMILVLDLLLLYSRAPLTHVLLLNALLALSIMAAAKPLVVRAVVRRIRRRMERAGGKSLYAPTTMAIDAEGISLRNDYAQGRTPWHAVQQVEQTPQHIFVFLDALNGLAVPKRCFASKDDATEFFDRACRLLEQAPPQD